jgi:hypothetical protein
MPHPQTTNTPQTRSIDLPSDSNFAVAMRSQQQAERAEQQRIKSLVLNYDLGSNEDNQDGESTSPINDILQPNTNRIGRNCINRKNIVKHSNSSSSKSPEFNTLVAPPNSAPASSSAPLSAFVKPKTWKEKGKENQGAQQRNKGRATR